MGTQCTSVRVVDCPPTPTENPRHDVQDPAWSSEDDLFNQYEAQSMASVQSERSLENMIQRRSRVSSQENGGSSLYVTRCYSNGVFTYMYMIYSSPPPLKQLAARGIASFPGRVGSKNNTADCQLGLVLIVSGCG